MKTKNFYIAEGSGVFGGVQVRYNEVDILCLNHNNEIKFDKTNRQNNLIKTVKKVFFIRGLFLFFYNLYIFFKDYNISLKTYNKLLLKKDVYFRRAKRREINNFRFFLVSSAIVFLVFLPFVFKKIVGSVFVGFLFYFFNVCFRFVCFTIFLLILKRLKITANIFGNSSAIGKVLNSLRNQNTIDYSLVDKKAKVFIISLQTSFITNFFLLFAIVPLVFANTFVAQIIVRIAVAFFIICLAYEIQLIVQYNYKKNRFAFALGFLFFYFSFITDIEPKESQKRLAKVAMEEIIQMNFDKVNNINKKEGEVPFSKVLEEVKTILIKSGIDDPMEARYLICETLGIDKVEMTLLRSITKKQEDKIKKVLLERTTRKPLCKILGYKYFYGLKFKVNNFVLSPRQETEILVDEVVKFINNSKKKLNVLDMCTGSGAIAVAIKKNADCNMVAVDKCKRALSVATQNAKEHNCDIQFFQGDMFKYLKVENKFDIITCNPPYIESKEIENLDLEVKNYDPRKALDGGADGLKFYKIIANESQNFLKDNGKLFLEIGFDQAESVSKLLEKNFKDICVIEDFAGLPRIIKAVKK
jgi:release factor glutamine methyltransferase